MNRDELKEEFKKQIREVIDNYAEKDPKCAFAAGMLNVLTALIVKDGPTLAYQIRVMHVALREVGEERGWRVATN